MTAKKGQEQESFRLSQAYNVMPPQPGEAYPILCSEWDYLKARIRSVATEAVILHTLGSILIGAGLSTLLSIMLGSFPDKNGVTSVSHITAWAVVAVTLICGVVFWIVAHVLRKHQVVRAGDVVEYMETI